MLGENMTQEFKKKKKLQRIGTNQYVSFNCLVNHLGLSTLPRRLGESEDKLEIEKGDAYIYQGRRLSYFCIFI